LTYVTLDNGNGGIVRNLSHDGLSVQAVARLRPEQEVRVRFELRSPRLRVETHGQVKWANASGLCGIRFVDLSLRASHQIDEWIFANLLDGVARESLHPHGMFATSVVSIAPEKDGGLIVSSQRRPAIRLEPSESGEPTEAQHRQGVLDGDRRLQTQVNWLSRPLSARTLAGMVDSLVMIAALLLFVMIFLSITHELPRWQLTLSAGVAAGAMIAATYWTLFTVVGGKSPGKRLARAAAGAEEEEENRGGSRFR
jgi:hypothetical protein